MSDFTYEIPDEQDFLYTLRSYFDALDNAEVAALLTNCTCSIQPSGDYSRIRWNALSTSFTLHVPVARLPKFTDSICEQIWEAVQRVFPPEAGCDITSFHVAPLIEKRPQEEGNPINQAPKYDGGIIEHDGLRFRSRSETKIYESLKKRNVLFFANAIAVLGGKNAKREPDFLICQDGKWGILEVMGEQYHPSATAMRDHDRARLFKDYGLLLIEFYDAARCYTEPERVVDDFLNRLKKV